MQQAKLLLIGFFIIVMAGGCSDKEHSHDDNSHSHSENKHDSIN